MYGVGTGNVGYLLLLLLTQTPIQKRIGTYLQDPVLHNEKGFQIEKLRDQVYYFTKKERSLK